MTPLWSPPPQDLITTIAFRFSNSVTTQPTVKSSLQGRGITRPFKNVGLPTQYYFSVVSQKYAFWTLPASRMLCGKHSLALQTLQTFEFLFLPNQHKSSISRIIPTVYIFASCFSQFTKQPTGTLSTALGPTGSTESIW